MSPLRYLLAAAVILGAVAPATAAPIVQIKSRTRIELSPPSRTATGAVVSGRVVDEATGAGVPGVSVAVTLGDSDAPRHLTTGDDGDFAVELSRPATVTVRFPGGPHYADTTAAMTVEAAPAAPTGPLPPAFAAADKPAPVLVSSTLIACAVAFFAVGAFVILRARPLATLGGAWRKRDPATAPADPAPGLHVAPPGSARSLRRARDLRLAGWIADAVTGAPVAGARLAITGPAPQEPILVSADGRFDRTLVAGLWNLEVTAAGYMRYATDVAMPHHGQLADARIDLMSVREKLFALYREVAEPLLPEPRLWGVWSPRQVFDHIRQSGPAEGLATLTAFIEEAYFSARVPDEALIGRARDLCAAAMTT